MLNRQRAGLPRCLRFVACAQTDLPSIAPEDPPASAPGRRGDNHQIVPLSSRYFSFRRVNYAPLNAPMAAP